MVVKILCLHGMGDNSEVFKSQTASFRELLPNSCHFDFVNADDICTPPNGVKELHPGPYRCWYKSPSTRNVRDAHRIIQDYISTNGPYDIVMGFSQGACIAASLLLSHHMEHAQDVRLFKAAVFFCSPLPFSKDTKFGIDVRQSFGVPVKGSLSDNRPTHLPTYLMPDPYFLQQDADIDPTAKSHTVNEEEIFYNMFHHTVDSARIVIPTAHIYGRVDPWRAHSMDLMKLCEKPIGYQHDGGHEIPKISAAEICDVIEEVVSRAGISL